MGYNYPYKNLAKDTINELSKSDDPDILDKFIKELRKLSKQNINKGNAEKFIKNCPVSYDCSPNGCYRYFICKEGN